MNHIPKVQDLERAHGVTWGELAGLEPRLLELLWQARAAGAGCRSREEVRQVFAPFRNAVAELLGLRGSTGDIPFSRRSRPYSYWAASISRKTPQNACNAGPSRRPLRRTR